MTSGTLSQVGESSCPWLWEQPPLPGLDEILRATGAGSETEFLSLFVLLDDATDEEQSRWLADLADSASAQGWFIEATCSDAWRWQLCCYPPASSRPRAPGLERSGRSPNGPSESGPWRPERAAYEHKVSEMVASSLAGEIVMHHSVRETAPVLWELARRGMPVEHDSGGAGSYHWFYVPDRHERWKSEVAAASLRPSQASTDDTRSTVISTMASRADKTGDRAPRPKRSSRKYVGRSRDSAPPAAPYPGRRSSARSPAGGCCRGGTVVVARVGPLYERVQRRPVEELALLLTNP